MLPLLHLGQEQPFVVQPQGGAEPVLQGRQVLGPGDRRRRGFGEGEERAQRGGGDGRTPHGRRRRPAGQGAGVAHQKEAEAGRRRGGGGGGEAHRSMGDPEEPQEGRLCRGQIII